MLRRLRTRSGQGFLEVVVITVLFGALVAVAVPVYMGVQGRKAGKRAQANLVAAVQMAEAFRAEHGSYRGMDTVDLLRIDPRLSPTLTVASAERRSYCLTDTVDGRTWSLRGPYRGDAGFRANATCE